MFEISEKELIEWMSYFMIVMSIVAVVALQIWDAPYGRYSDSAWGYLVNGKVAWVLQELPAFLFPFCNLFWFIKELSPISLLFLLMFLTHYTQRALIFPMLIKGGKPSPFIPFALALIFCVYNGFIQSRYLVNYAQYPEDWIYSPQALLGTCLFFSGMAINIHSDHILRNLRKPGETGYKIPTGGMFDYVSGANFFGESVEWFGFFLASWSLPALAFFTFTVCNIGPRAFSHHRWYLKKFADDYPKDRKAFIPFIL